MLSWKSKRLPPWHDPNAGHDFVLLWLIANDPYPSWLPKHARAPRDLHPRRPAMVYLPCNLTHREEILLAFALTIAAPCYK
jgi:hypothetical protein